MIALYFGFIYISTGNKFQSWTFYVAMLFGMTIEITSILGQIIAHPAMEKTNLQTVSILANRLEKGAVHLPPVCFTYGSSWFLS